MLIRSRTKRLRRLGLLDGQPVEKKTLYFAAKGKVYLGEGYLEVRSGQHLLPFKKDFGEILVVVNGGDAVMRSIDELEHRYTHQTRR